MTKHVYIKTKIYALFVNNAYNDILGLVVLYKENIQ